MSDVECDCLNRSNGHKSNGEMTCWRSWAHTIHYDWLTKRTSSRKVIFKQHTPSQWYRKNVRQPCCEKRCKLQSEERFLHWFSNCRHLIHSPSFESIMTLYSIHVCIPLRAATLDHTPFLRSMVWAHPRHWPTADPVVSHNPSLSLFFRHKEIRDPTERTATWTEFREHRLGTGGLQPHWLAKFLQWHIPLGRCSPIAEHQKNKRVLDGIESWKPLYSTDRDPFYETDVVWQTTWQSCESFSGSSTHGIDHFQVFRRTWIRRSQKFVFRVSPSLHNWPSTIRQTNI